MWRYVKKNGTFAHTWDKSAHSWFSENWTPDTSTSETISTICETIIKYGFTYSCLYFSISESPCVYTTTIYSYTGTIKYRYMFVPWTWHYRTSRRACLQWNPGLEHSHTGHSPRRRNVQSWNVTLLSLKTKRLKVYKLVIWVHLTVMHIIKYFVAFN